MISLGNLTFDPEVTAVVEKHQEVGGRDARAIRLSGLLDDLEAPDDLEAALDEVLQAASVTTGLASLRLRTSRYLLVRRVAFTREVHRPGAAARYMLDLEAPDPYEYSTYLQNAIWAVTEEGGVLIVTSAGNTAAPVQFSFTPDADAYRPSFSDGTHTLTYDGQVLEGSTLYLDGVDGKVTLDGEDVTPYTEGALPRISPGESTFTYAAQWPHNANIIASWRDRWW